MNSLSRAIWPAALKASSSCDFFIKFQKRAPFFFGKYPDKRIALSQPLAVITILGQDFQHTFRRVFAKNFFPLTQHRRPMPEFFPPMTEIRAWNSHQ